MGKSVIAVPIHLDALYVKEQSTVAPAMADFTRLPYFDGNMTIFGPQAMVPPGCRSTTPRLSRDPGDRDLATA
jgi:hypothetical protein